MKDLSIIIVNYHSEAFLQNCLTSVFEFTRGVEYEVIVVDNSADSGDCARLLQQFKQVRYIAMNDNGGFARANNAGIAACDADVVLLLNSDTVVRDNAIGKCYERIMQLPDHVAAGVQLVFPDGMKQISGSNNLAGGLNYLMTIPYLGTALSKLAKMIGIQKPGVEDVNARQVDVDWINGAFLMAKRSVIAKEGMLDEEFFLYHEESEWCSRLERSGKLCVFGDLDVVHLEGGSANAAYNSQTKAHSNLYDKKGLQLLVSMMLRLRKQFGAGWLLFHMLAHTLCLPITFLLALFSRGGSLGIWLGYAGNLMKCWSLVPKMLLRQPHFYKVV